LEKLGNGLGWSSLLAAVLLAPIASRAHAQAIPAEVTTVVAPLAGRLATPAPGQQIARRFAPELGLTDIHEGELRIIFGDVIQLRDGDPISVIRDDVQGRISLADFPDGDAVDAYVAARPPAEGQASWQHQGPPVFYRLTSWGLASAITLHDGGPGGRALNTGLFKAPLAAFSNAQAGEASGFFTIYARSVPVECSGGERPSCDDGLECEPRLGKVGGNALEDGPVCLIGARYCRAVPGGGLCVDPTSSLYDRELDSGLLQGIAWKHSIGNADRQTHERYYTRPWSTNKFTNLSARTVNDFDPQRVRGEGNDYRPTDGTNPAASKVLLWGRAGYVGTKADGRDLQLYFAVADVPSYSSGGEIEWSPRYFTGLGPDGAPQFSSRQVDAAPLDLSGTPRAENEVWDVVNQMSVSWVEALDSWVMLYGGGANDVLAELFTAGLGASVEHDPEGAIHVRFARQPWGPWSAPQQLFAAGDPHPLGETPADQSQYAPGGILRHPMCVTGGCAPREPGVEANDYGFFYAPNIIDAWTVPTPKGARIYWNVSTWHPYQVVLLKTELEPGFIPTPTTDGIDGGRAGEPTARDGGTGDAATAPADAAMGHAPGGDRGGPPPAEPASGGAVPPAATAAQGEHAISDSRDSLAHCGIGWHGAGRGAHGHALAAAMLVSLLALRRAARGSSRRAAVERVRSPR
jgi:hypothetical protein